MSFLASCILLFIFCLASKPFLRTNGYHLGTKRGGVQDDAKRSSAVQEGETGGSAALHLKKQNRRATKDSVDCILSTEHKNVVFQKCPRCIALSASGLSYRADHSTKEKHFFLSWKEVQKQQATPQSYARALLKVVLSTGKALTFISS